MSKGKARVPQEGDGRRRSVPDAGESGTKRPAQPEDVDRAKLLVVLLKGRGAPILVPVK